MNGGDLKTIRIKLTGDSRGSIKTMAQKLETPYRTYQDWEARKGAIPGVVSVAIKALKKLDDIERFEPEDLNEN